MSKSSAIYTQEQMDEAVLSARVGTAIVCLFLAGLALLLYFIGNEVGKQKTIGDVFGESEIPSRFDCMADTEDVTVGYKFTKTGSYIGEMKAKKYHFYGCSDLMLH